MNSKKFNLHLDEALAGLYKARTFLSRSYMKNRLEKKRSIDFTIQSIESLKLKEE